MQCASAERHISSHVMDSRLQLKSLVEILQVPRLRVEVQGSELTIVRKPLRLEQGDRIAAHHGKLSACVGKEYWRPDQARLLAQAPATIYASVGQPVQWTDWPAHAGIDIIDSDDPGLERRALFWDAVVRLGSALKVDRANFVTIVFPAAIAHDGIGNGIADAIVAVHPAFAHAIVQAAVGVLSAAVAPHQAKHVAHEYTCAMPWWCGSWICGSSPASALFVVVPIGAWQRVQRLAMHVEVASGARLLWRMVGLLHAPVFWMGIDVVQYFFHAAWARLDQVEATLATLTDGDVAGALEYLARMGAHRALAVCKHLIEWPERHRIRVDDENLTVLRQIPCSQLVQGRSTKSHR